MTWTPPRRALAACLALAVGFTAGCTADERRTPAPDPAPAPASLRLVSFPSCAEALADLRRAAKAHVGPFGFQGGADPVGADGSGPARTAAGAASTAYGGEPAYSATNTHEPGVDEPDLVKTDGRRIVTVSGTVLRVVDAARRVETGRLELRAAAASTVARPDADLLLHGDRALVLLRDWLPMRPGADGGRISPAGAPSGPRVVLVDLAGATPRLLAEYRIDGSLVDARQVGGTARVVVRSAPRIAFPYGEGSDASRVAANRRIIDRAGEADWLPRYTTTAGGRTTSGRVGCDRLSRPPDHSGTSLVTVLSFDLARTTLGDGDPVTVVADADTVYGTGRSLYLADDGRWRRLGWGTGPRGDGPPARTALYAFDTAGPGRPRFVAAGSVPGWLINQYALSEWDGHLRVAVTTDEPWAGDTGSAAPTSESAVHTLTRRGARLAPVGTVGGLGKGERVFAVRFAGPVGYVVTFRQVDPLYTVDLRDPARPRVTGELKITGYSAYLHPAGDGRLIGIGQEASAEGQVQGTQVSLFDVSNLDRPARLARHHVRGGYSQAESDPHAFLYWPAERLLVVPVTSFDRTTGGKGDGGALVLRATDAGFTEVGTVRHPSPGTGGPTLIRRSLVVGDVLWTVSDAGLRAVRLGTLGQLSWLPA
ncbi:MAG TPA: beta-propeller domain-containing protein [Pilimelia sp.]|nr:beta-propeller domain-containing protein [Pilimelia sp.]